MEPESKRIKLNPKHELKNITITNESKTLTGSSAKILSSNVIDVTDEIDNFTFNQPSEVKISNSSDLKKIQEVIDWNAIWSEVQVLEQTYQTLLEREEYLLETRSTFSYGLHVVQKLVEVFHQKTELLGRSGSFSSTALTLALQSPLISSSSPPSSESIKSVVSLTFSTPSGNSATSETDELEVVEIRGASSVKEPHEKLQEGEEEFLID